MRCSDWRLSRCASCTFSAASTPPVGWCTGRLRRHTPLGLPLPAALYGVLVWPFIWGLTEQMTYNGYLLPRFQVLCRSTSLAIAIVAFVWSLQHAFMPLTFDARFMAFRLLSPVPESIFVTWLYLRLRRVLPLAIAHALMDGATVVIGALLPLLRA
jgi:membrane protease YdiL (CAAX protease family)